MKNRIVRVFLALVITLAGTATVYAQTQTPPEGPIYIVSPGDSLLEIANRFNVSLDLIMAANNISNPDQLFPGDQLIVPGLTGISGVLTSRVIEFGETNIGLARQLRNSYSQLIKLNRIISPTEFYAGANLIIIDDPDKPAWTNQMNSRPGETLLETAVLNHSDTWTVSSINDMQGSWEAIPFEPLFIPDNESNSTFSALLMPFQAIQVDPLPVTQGSTLQVSVTLVTSAEISGEMGKQSFAFYAIDETKQVALQGIHALLEPGLYPLRLSAKLADGSMVAFEQLILVKSANFPSEVLYVDPSYIDEMITIPEQEFISNITGKVTTQKYWNGLFTSPASEYEADSLLSSRYGNRRTYYGIGTDLVVAGFHTGLDFGGGTGLPITSPASGVVVFAGPLEVRGNATIIDHGWGIFSGIWHQSEIYVEAGDLVEQGQVIGLVGGTGRVTGAHLHCEIWVNGVQVDPMGWLENAYPLP